MDNFSTTGYRILILEDEFIIAETLTRQLERNHHVVVGQAISYAEAVSLFHDQQPDLALLDIRVSGNKTGIDFAHYLRAQEPGIPFIFLTSQVDAGYLDRVKQTMPSGCLSKPIQLKSLLATIEVAIFNHLSQRAVCEVVTLRDGRATHRVPLNTIEYVEADHVYVKVHLSDNSNLVLRNTLSDLVSQLGQENLLQTHRSYAVNPQKITRYDRDFVYLREKQVPVSRGRRASVENRL
ncbi:LytTR family two component transcriptional regulator [Neolewinella xylanilytica]|uniref:LytTR family two component transcriptional regulator n=1 Tax=Neolewinella xylanilytica TaxID=1514080 RepID=A0A2S6I4V6_9BACT|nr:response regulator [Neolewinella xylanilytica]PPK86196.1 LytTR family two component transcriptional regulator [Neolewinella xylanilytica]